MRHLLFLFALITFGHASGAQGVAVYEISKPVVISSGSFKPEGNELPWYTKFDSIGATAGGRGGIFTDTFKQKVAGVCAVTFQFRITDEAHNASDTYVDIWASADSGKGADYSRISSYQIPYDSRSGIYTYAYAYAVSGNYYTNYWCIIRDGTADLITWKGCLMVR